MKAKKKLPKTTAIPQEVQRYSAALKAAAHAFGIAQALAPRKGRVSEEGAEAEKLQYGEEPCHLVTPLDIPSEPPTIRQPEIVAYANAEDIYRRARIDYEERKWRLVRKLYLFSECETGSYEARLDENMRLIVVDRSSQQTVKTKLRIF